MQTAELWPSYCLIVPKAVAYRHAKNMLSYFKWHLIFKYDHSNIDKILGNNWHLCIQLQTTTERSVLKTNIYCSLRSEANSRSAEQQIWNKKKLTISRNLGYIACSLLISDVLLPWSYAKTMTDIAASV